MGAKQLAWRACYELLAARVREPGWAFMNYGYAPVGAGAGLGASPQVELDPRDEPDRYCIQLFRHALAGTEVRGADVLEVGSGRGGGAAHVSRYLHPRSTTGLDFSRRAVELSRRHRRGPGLSFVAGDAQAMPFAAESFDVVVNIESSHCYASMDAFLAEAHRVLRPGGVLAWADLRDAAGLATLHAQLARSPLRCEAELDITANVLRAMELDNERKLALIDAWIPRGFQRAIRPFAGIRGTRNHEGLARGDVRYLSARLVKPEAPPP
ncbi:class I SAM-dependent methyltransferase [Pengzhenrongella sicca]|uniref:Methyltransferase domain-containing protein n=1 Tax=Pengzhenrongella sicca TaxID=2819238 RepID=A0A8A4ZFR6_9MICO|nr:class I SAM-dependent methyltransferase [Pengzhenrongella sicca]QTE30852.1 methyltransferase domain-containing protein [Pengzhenrongella sicca]